LVKSLPSKNRSFRYEFFKNFFIKEKLTAAGVSATALCAGWITTTVTNPIWVVHTRVLLEKVTKQWKFCIIISGKKSWSFGNIPKYTQE